MVVVQFSIISGRGRYSSSPMHICERWAQLCDLYWDQ